MERCPSAGGRSRTATRGAWVLENKPAGEDQGREEGAWAGAQRGEVPTEFRKGGGAPGVKLWGVTLMGAEQWDSRGKERAFWYLGFFLQWG